MDMNFIWMDGDPSASIPSPWPKIHGKAPSPKQVHEHRGSQHVLWLPSGYLLHSYGKWVCLRLTYFSIKVANIWFDFTHASPRNTSQFTMAKKSSMKAHHSPGFPRPKEWPYPIVSNHHIVLCLPSLLIHQPFTFFSEAYIHIWALN